MLVSCIVIGRAENARVSTLGRQLLVVGTESMESSHKYPTIIKPVGTRRKLNALSERGKNNNVEEEEGIHRPLGVASRLHICSQQAAAGCAGVLGATAVKLGCTPVSCYLHPPRATAPEIDRSLLNIICLLNRVAQGACSLLAYKALQKPCLGCQKR